MKNMFKKSLAAVMAVASLAVGMVGISASAAESTIPVDGISSSIDTEASVYSSKSFSFTNVGPSGAFLSGTFTLTSTKTVTVMFDRCTLGKAHVAFINNSDNSEVGTPFVIPEAAGTTLYYYQELPAGTYKFYVTPSGCPKTSGSFSIIY